MPEGNDEKALAVLQAAADSITLEKLAALTNNAKTDNQPKQQSGVKSREISFSEEEIRKMPKTFKKEFRVEGSRRTSTRYAAAGRTGAMS